MALLVSRCPRCGAGTPGNDYCPNPSCRAWVPGQVTQLITGTLDRFGSVLSGTSARFSSDAGEMGRRLSYGQRRTVSELSTLNATNARMLSVQQSVPPRAPLVRSSRTGVVI
jgi:hypothetical protein